MNDQSFLLKISIFYTDPYESLPKDDLRLLGGWRDDATSMRATVTMTEIE